MRRLLLAIAAVIGLAILTAAGPLANAAANAQEEAPTKESAPDVPDAIAVPAGVEPVLFVRAKGSQIYSCQAGADGKYSWTLKGSRSGLDRPEG
jgi:hypothetical protein